MTLISSCLNENIIIMDKLWGI